MTATDSKDDEKSGRGSTQTVRIPPEMWPELRAKMATDGAKFQGIVMSFLRSYLEGKASLTSEGNSNKPVPPPANLQDQSTGDVVNIVCTRAEREWVSGFLEIIRSSMPNVPEWIKGNITMFLDGVRHYERSHRGAPITKRTVSGLPERVRGTQSDQALLERDLDEAEQDLDEAEEIARRLQERDGGSQRQKPEHRKKTGTRGPRH